MGQTGVGKSTFVNHFTDSSTAKVGDELESCTQSLQPIPVEREHLPPPFKNRQHAFPDKYKRLVIVDTPGFDDTYKDNSEIAGQLAQWLKDHYGKGARLEGIVYLHDISQPRVEESYRGIFHLFAQLCEKDIVGSLLLVTTKWDGISQQEIGAKREQQLRTKFWGAMINQGAQTHRFKGDSTSAQEIILNLLKVENDLRMMHNSTEQGGEAKILRSKPETRSKGPTFWSIVKSFF
ncbi:P-loop containing nucleoside triphosphate hydrolase protein [Gymnopilus junonius]|uniref:P-loop containing nucleoside triphosphate hydrolase protein n=1 Tax=Gymnopilus junonius TaxID=109634 RepID=A0A9P5TJV6_GYMJU|nr:P-loop containing nucleoside triphosphate hydrolase protein [Gymnopilus junonius]